MALCDAHSLDEPANKFPEVAQIVAPIRRRYPRVIAQFEVQTRSVDELFEVLSRDISHGGTFLCSNQLLPPETPVQLAFIHPIDRSTFVMDGTIVRAVESPPAERGLAVEFTDRSEARKRAFAEFIEGGLPHLDLEEHMLVGYDDSQLL